MALHSNQQGRLETLPTLPEMQLWFDMARLLLAKVGKWWDTSLLGEECVASCHHGTCLCARLEAAPPLTPPGIWLWAGAACRAWMWFSMAVPGAENRPSGCLNGKNIPGNLELCGLVSGSLSQSILHEGRNMPRVD